VTGGALQEPGPATIKELRVAIPADGAGDVTGADGRLGLRESAVLTRHGDPAEATGDSEEEFGTTSTGWVGGI